MKKLFSLFLSILIVTIGYAQYNVVVIDNSYDPNEPSIELNPYNTNQIVAGANLNSYYYSHDGGYTWTENTLTSIHGVWGDPAIICDVNEDFYFFHLSNDPTGTWIDRIVCQKSTDAGVSWNNGSYTGLNGIKKQDKEWPTVDRSNNNIYVTWTQFDNYGSSNPNDSSAIMFSRSVDAGDTWTPAVRINRTGGDCQDNDHTVEGAVPAVGPGGEVYVAWAGRRTTGDLAIMFDKSDDFGTTWLNEDIFVTDFPEGWVVNIPGIMRCNGLPVIKCDTSGGNNHGRIYINWTDQQNGTDDTDVWMISSDDGGETWGEKIRVNDDAPGKHQFFTWFDIDQTNGNLYFVFYDRRNYSDNQTDVFMAVSEDGGETFENIKISETPFNPNAGVFFGDYTNISVHDGKIAPIWARADGTSMSLRTIVPDNSGITDNIDLLQSLVFPNPSNNAFYFSYKLTAESVISLNVFDISGKEICSIFENKSISPGKYIESFNPEKYNLPSGVYYFKFSDGRKLKINKFIYNK